MQKVLISEDGSSFWDGYLDFAGIFAAIGINDSKTKVWIYGYANPLIVQVPLLQVNKDREIERNRNYTINSMSSSQKNNMGEEFVVKEHRFRIDIESWLDLDEKEHKIVKLHTNFEVQNDSFKSILKYTVGVEEVSLWQNERYKLTIYVAEMFNHESVRILLQDKIREFLQD